MSLLLATLFLLILSANVFAVDNIVVQGLFTNKAVVSIDGKRHILAVGETSPEGVKLVSADSRGAVLEVDGREGTYQPGSAVSTTFAKPETSTETVFKNSAGMYMTYGSINGRSVHFLVDTGASAISMNADQASQLGIQYDKIGKPASVSTASGFVKAYRLQLRTVSVGQITQKNVEAFVIDGKHPGPILLGMTFLGRLNVEHNGNAMKLIQ